MAELVFEGGENLIKILRDIPKNLKTNALKAASRPAARIIANGARAELKNSPVFKSQGTDDGFSKLLAVAKSVKVVTWKTHVNVQIDPRYPDIPVKGSKRPYWTIYGYARLLGQGRQWTGNTTTGRMSHNTGTTRGAEDFVEKSTDRNAGAAQGLFLDKIGNEVEKALDRAVKRYGKK